jgi:trigger factor
MDVETEALKIAIEKPAAWARRLTITVPQARIQRERKSAMSRLAQRVKLPGFRKGKVPVGVLEKRFGAAIEQETVERLIGDAYREAVKQEGLQPITQGAVEGVEYQPGSDLTFRVDLEVRPEIELERIGGFTVRREAQPVGDEQVDAVLERLRAQQAVWEPLEAGLADGDAVVVEIVPLDDPDAGAPRSYQLTLGQGQALPAIEDAIRTLEPETEGEFTVDLPEDADQPDSPVKPHSLRIRLVEAKRPRLPELDDEFARSVGEFATVSDLRDKIRADLEEEAGREADRGVRLQLLQNILDANSFEVPNAMIDDYLARLLPEAKDADAEKMAEIRASAAGPAAEAIRRSLVVERIAEMESLAATAAEVEARVADAAEKLGRDVAEVRGRFAKSGRLTEIEHEITEDKVFEYLTSLSTIE